MNSWAKLIVMILAKPKTLFTPALGLSLLVHAALLFSVFPKPQAIDALTAQLGFEPSRITISSILTSEPIKKVIPKTVRPRKSEPALSAPVQNKKSEAVLKQNSQVKTFDEAIIKNTPPTYPRIARKRGWQGEVELLIHVTAKGAVKTIDVLKSNAHSVLTKSAVKSAKTWLFSPSKNQLPYQVKKIIKYQLK